MKEHLSPRELAEAIGVSESSLKRWADEGLLQVSLTPGGHRRILLREAIRYIRQEGMPLLKPHLLGLESPPGVSAKAGDVNGAIQNAVLHGHVETVRGAVVAQYLAGRSVAEICDGPLTRAMHIVGEFWKRGPEGIFVEHRAVDVCTQALNQLRAILPAAGAKAPAAVGGALEDDPYSLPTLMVASVLGAAGWRTVNAGANLPLVALHAAVIEQMAELVWISCSVEEVARRREKELRNFGTIMKQQGIKVVVGGRGWKNLRFDQESGLTMLGSMVEMTAFAEGLRAASAK